MILLRRRTIFFYVTKQRVHTQPNIVLNFDSYRFFMLISLIKYQVVYKLRKIKVRKHKISTVNRSHTLRISYFHNIQVFLGIVQAYVPQH